MTNLLYLIDMQLIVLNKFGILYREMCLLPFISFLSSSKLIGEVKATLITFEFLRSLSPLIWQNVDQFRLWNTIYICITNILVKILKSCLDKLICSTQTALMPGRRIAENVLAQELVRIYHRNLGRCAIKVGKAYDFINYYNLSF